MISCPKVKDPLIRIGLEENETVPPMPCYQVWARDKQDWKPEFKNQFRWHSFAYTFALLPHKARAAAINLLRMPGMFN